MPPKTRLAEKKEGATDKNVSAVKKKCATGKKKNVTVVKRREMAERKRRDAVKKKRDTAKKKRKRDSGVDGESSSNPTKRARNRADREGTSSPALPSQPQKSTTHAPSEAENPLQPPVTSLSVSGSSTKSPSHRVDNEDEEIGSNNRDSHSPEAAIGNDAQRTAGQENMVVEPMRPVGFFFKSGEYGQACKLPSRVTETDVEEKLLKMKTDGSDSDERLKMVILYFLARVIRGRSKNGYFIEPFILQAWTFPGFIISVEILAFECIPVLRERFRDPIPNCLADCPRMCKWNYKKTGTTRFALDEIYQVLEKTKVISSILEPQGHEIYLLYDIMDEGTVEDILIEPEGKIFWEDLFEMDVRTRPTTQKQSNTHDIFEGQDEESVCEEPEAGGEAGRESVKELELRLSKRMDDGFALRDETIRLQAARVKELEQDKIQRENWSFQFGEYVTGEASGGIRREAEKDGDKAGDKEAKKDGDDGEAAAEKHGEKQVEEEAEKSGEDGEKQLEEEAEKDGEDGEEETEKDDDDDGNPPSTLEIMADAAEKFEKTAAEKAVEKAATDGENTAANEEITTTAKTAEVGDDDVEIPKRVKRSHLLRSLFTPN
ncbi:hypothetical protein Bca4012_027522 [Brassica carinata]|uniref:Uncharacterized protein n=1 Tax=Brassica carinata TaxID=52824 RepID=A0A8X7VKK7_BRACI|nr:hypothetical protein Bca52824_024478 [Brassica carinata]